MLSEQQHDLSVGCLAACCFPVNSPPRLLPQLDDGPTVASKRGLTVDGQSIPRAYNEDLRTKPPVGFSSRVHACEAPLSACELTINK